MQKLQTLIPLLCLVLLSGVALGQKVSPAQLPKAATPATIEANKRVLKELNFNEKLDYRNAQRYLIDTLPNGVIKDKEGKTVWDMNHYLFLRGYTPETCPPELNPSLMRQEQLNTYAGLYAVVPDHIYQIRGFDLSVMSLIKGKTGWIVMDPLVTEEAAKAGIELAKKHLRGFRTSAIIFTHSHIDHYGGVLGVIEPDQIGKIPVYAPEGFLEHAFNENIMAGTAMGRRASYMYGNTIAEHDARGQVGAGLGKTTSSGKSGILVPTISINATIEQPYTTPIDGVNVHIWNSPNTEAPTEMMFYFPDFKAFCSAEEVTQTMHNTYSLRGTMVRDPLAWSQYIDQALIRYGKEVEVIFASHHWPTWGNDTIVNLLKKQRDLYKYINDQTLRLTNQGYTMIEIGEQVKLPKTLSQLFPNRGYYGTLNHNVKATYQRYIGWFDGNPANLHSLPPTEAGKKYVEFMGGADSVLKMAKKSYDKGEFRWVGMVLNHLVFADPKNMPARYLLADSFEQMGYQAESGPWRNFYLTGARELRDTNRLQFFTQKNNVEPNRDDLDNMDAQEYFQYLAIHLNGLQVEGKEFAFNLIMHEKNDATTFCLLKMENSVLQAYPKVLGKQQNPLIGLNRSLMNDLMIKGGKEAVRLFDDAVKNGKAIFTGTAQDRANWTDFLLALEPFPFWFNIIEP